VLLGGEQKRLWQSFAPGAQNLSGYPGMGRLADGENAGGLIAEQHWKTSAAEVCGA
jgi:hypothetical protein